MDQLLVEKMGTGIETLVEQVQTIKDSVEKLQTAAEQKTEADFYRRRYLAILAAAVERDIPADLPGTSKNAETFNRERVSGDLATLSQSISEMLDEVSINVNKIAVTTREYHLKELRAKDKQVKAELACLRFECCRKISNEFFRCQTQSVWSVPTLRAHFSQWLQPGHTQSNVPETIPYFFHFLAESDLKMITKGLLSGPELAWLRDKRIGFIWVILMSSIHLI